MITVSRKTAIVLLLVTTVFWGSSFPFTKALTTVFSPLWVVALRFGLAGLVLLCLVRRELITALRTAQRNDLLLLCALGFLNFLAILCFTKSLQQIEVTNSGFILSSSLLLVPFLEFMFRGRPLYRTTLIGVALLALGLYLMSFGFNAPGAFRTGESAAFVAALLYAAYIIVIGALSKKFHAGVIMCCVFLITAAAASPIALLINGIPLSHFPETRICVDLAYLALIGTAAPYVLMGVGQRTLDNQTAAFIYILEPVFATIIALMFFGEAVNSVKWLGAAIVLVGQYIAIAGRVNNQVVLKKQQGAPGDSLM
jgi:drug/metabolite transporter (DMT)-like permease